MSTGDRWEPPLRRPILEALSSLARMAAMRPVGYRVVCSLDGDTLEFAARVCLTAAMTKKAERLPLLLYRELAVTEAAIDDAPCGVERSGELVWLSSARPIGAGENVSCRLSYRGRFPSAFVEREGGDLWVELAPQVFWYPMVSAGAVDYFVFQLDCQLPRGLNAAANGDVVETAETPTGVRRVWENRAGAPGIAVLAGPFLVRRYLTEGCELHCYVRPGLDAQLDEVSSEAGGIAAFYAERFGRPPAGAINLVVPPHSVGGNWAQPNMIVCGQLSPTSDPLRRFQILAHEIAHQWWGHAVRVDFLSDLWLPEGLAAFSMLLATMRLKGEDALTDSVQEWTIPRYERARRAQVTLAQCRPDSPHSDELREDASAIFLALLRAQVGAGKFDHRLRAFLHRYRGRVATTSDFERAMAAEASESVRSFVHRWLHEVPLPEVDAKAITVGLR